MDGAFIGHRATDVRGLQAVHDKKILLNGWDVFLFLLLFVDTRKCHHLIKLGLLVSSMQLRFQGKAPFWGTGEERGGICMNPNILCVHVSSLGTGLFYQKAKARGTVTPGFSSPVVNCIPPKCIAVSVQTTTSAYHTLPWFETLVGKQWSE